MKVEVEINGPLRKVLFAVYCSDGTKEGIRVRCSGIGSVKMSHYLPALEDMALIIKSKGELKAKDHGRLQQAPNIWMITLNGIRVAKQLGAQHDHERQDPE